jgi:hypothetical protein
MAGQKYYNKFQPFSEYPIIQRRTKVTNIEAEILRQVLISDSFTQNKDFVFKFQVWVP